MVRNSGWRLRGHFGRFSPPVAVVASALALAGCTGSMPSFGGFGGFGGSAPPPEPAMQPAPAPEIPPSIRVSEVIGRWGYAAFHKPEDRARTEAAARAQCNHPYVIGQGPTGGVMMYPADQSELQELRLKGSTSGKNYIGPVGEAGRTAGPRESSPSTAASCCCDSPIPRSRAATAPASMCAARRAPAVSPNARNSRRRI